MTYSRSHEIHFNDVGKVGIKPGTIVRIMVEVVNTDGKTQLIGRIQEPVKEGYWLEGITAYNRKIET
jgi:hypothetical protein